MCAELLALQEVESSDALDEVSKVLSSTGDATATTTTPQWMLDLSDNAQRWLEQLPQGGIMNLKESSESIKNPLFRFVRREITIGKKVLSKMIEGLNNIIAFAKGEIKATNDLRKLIAELAKEQIPKAWNAYKMYPLGVSIWVIDFVKRIEQLNQMVSNDYVNSPYEHCQWLGGIFSPEGFIAATRQYVASANQWPLGLSLSFQIFVFIFYLWFFSYFGFTFFFFFGVFKISIATKFWVKNRMYILKCKANKTTENKQTLLLLSLGCVYVNVRIYTAKHQKIIKKN